MAAKEPSKLRALVLIITGAIIVYFLLIFFTGHKPLVDTVNIKISSPPSIESVPGSVKDNARYKELQEKDNEKRAQQAKKSGQTNLPTLVNKTDQKNSEDDLFKDPKKLSEEKKPNKEDALKKAQDDAERRLKEQQARLDKLKTEQEDKRKQSEMARLETQKNQQGVKDLESKIVIDLAEMTTLTKVYATPAKQVYVSGQNSLVNAKKDPTPSVNPPLYKAGTVIYGVIETDYNSDNPGPILARITTGPLMGSRVIGIASSVSSEWASGLNVSFNMLSRPMAVKSQPINLQAVDPSTLQPAVATTANYHYGQRYGSLLMSGALSQGSQQAQSSSSGSTGSSSSASSSSTSSSSNSSVSLANPIAEDIISNLNKVASRPATYTIEQGTAVGLLFVNDFILES